MLLLTRAIKHRGKLYSGQTGCTHTQALFVPWKIVPHDIFIVGDDIVPLFGLPKKIVGVAYTPNYRVRMGEMQVIPLRIGFGLDKLKNCPPR